MMLAALNVRCPYCGKSTKKDDPKEIKFFFSDKKRNSQDPRITKEYQKDDVEGLDVKYPEDPEDVEEVQVAFCSASCAERMEQRYVGALVVLKRDVRDLMPVRFFNTNVQTTVKAVHEQFHASGKSGLIIQGRAYIDIFDTKTRIIRKQRKFDVKVTADERSVVKSKLPDASFRSIDFLTDDGGAKRQMRLQDFIASGGKSYYIRLTTSAAGGERFRTLSPLKGSFRIQKLGSTEGREDMIKGLESHLFYVAEGKPKGQTKFPFGKDTSKQDQKKYIVFQFKESNNVLQAIHFITYKASAPYPETAVSSNVAGAEGYGYAREMLGRSTSEELSRESRSSVILRGQSREGPENPLMKTRRYGEWYADEEPSCSDSSSSLSSSSCSSSSFSSSCSSSSDDEDDY